MAQRPPVKGKRLWKLASMTAGVAGDVARTRVKGMLGGTEDASELRKRAGKRVAHTLGELKGAAMKVGQMASAAKELLPPEVADAMASLQRDAPPMDYSVIAEQIEAELGSPPELLFRSFDDKPYAAASVGQVHRAVTDDGRLVVVKVQYPGVDEAVDSDLSQVKLALRLGGLVTIEREHFDAFFGELRARLHEELDYCNEADNVRRFRAFHARHDFLAVPDVVGERSAKRVLTLTWEPGRPMAELSGPGVGQELKDHLGTSMARVIISQLFEQRAIQADPNPANFAWREDGTLVLYDFGCVKELSEEIVQACRDIVHAADVKDYAGLDSAMIRLGPLREQAAPVPPEYYDRWLDALCEPLWLDGAYDFGSADIAREVLKLVPGALKRQHWWKPAPELAMLDRDIAGLYDIVREVGARVPLRSLLLPHIAPG